MQARYCMKIMVAMMQLSQLRSVGGAARSAGGREDRAHSGPVTAERLFLSGSYADGGDVGKDATSGELLPWCQHV